MRVGEALAQSMMITPASSSPSSGPSRMISPSSSNWRFFLGLESSISFPFVSVFSRLAGCCSKVSSSSGAGRFIALAGGVSGSFTLIFFRVCGSGCGSTNGGASSG